MPQKTDMETPDPKGKDRGFCFGGGVEQRAIYRCHINEQGDLLLFAWGVDRWAMIGG